MDLGPPIATAWFLLLSAQVGAVVRIPFIPWLRLCNDPALIRLPLAADGIAEAVLHTEGTSAQPSAHAIKHLAGAAGLLSAACDLRRTHQAADSGGVIADRTRWAKIIRSRPVALAMIRQMAGRCDRIASWLTRLVEGDATPPEAARGQDWMPRVNGSASPVR